MKLILCNFVMAEINQQLSQCNYCLMCAGEVSLFCIQPEHSCKYKLYLHELPLLREGSVVSSLPVGADICGSSFWKEKPVAGSFETRRMRA